MQSYYQTEIFVSNVFMTKQKNKISKFSYMDKSIYSENVMLWIFVTFMKLKKEKQLLIAI